MHFTLPHIFLSALLLGSAVNGAAIPEQSGSQLEERAACNADNLLRLLRGQENLPQGLEFCSSWLGKIRTTTTVVAETVTPTITNTEVPTNTITRLATETLTSTNTLYTTVTYFTTVTYTAKWIIIGLAKRAVATKKPLSDQILSNTYPASRISSACNCLTIAPGTTETAYITATAEPATTVVTIPTITETSFTVTSTAEVTTIVTSVTSETKTSWTTIYSTYLN